MARYVMLQYFGKTDPLRLRLKYLTKEYEFSSENGKKTLFLYEDALALLTENPVGYKVVSSVIEEDKEQDPEPVVVSREPEEPDSQEPTPITTGDTLPNNMMALKKPELIALAEKIGCPVEESDANLTMIKKIKTFMAGG